MATLTLNMSVLRNGVALTGLTSTETGTGSADSSFSESVANSTTDGAIVWAVDVSAVKALFLHSTQNVTVEVNDGTTPDATIDLIANVGVWWTPDSSGSNPLGSTDVTILYVTNASGSSATVSGYVVTDATP